MLPKENRADKKAIEKIFKEGKFINSPNLTFKFILSRNNAKRISFIVPKTVAKLATKRNLLRRRGYSALEKHINHFPAGLTGAFIFKKPENDVSILENEIKTVFRIILSRTN